MIKHKIKHQYQTTNNNCTQTALSMLLDFHGDKRTVKEISKSIPVNNNEKGEPWGTITQDLAVWCIDQGFKVEMFTFDFEIIDQSWIGKTPRQILERLIAIKGKHTNLTLGKHWSKEYVQGYINFIEAGGKLHIEGYPTTKLLRKLVKKSPVFATVCFNVLYTTGRIKNKELSNSVSDDVNGLIGNHSLIINGLTKGGDFIINDPWQKPGEHIIEPERLLAAITAAQIEADNLVFVLTK